ncbi:MAG: acetylxylan esterase [Clostridiales bacterium]|nr:acetylxylan esterase [Clostridiales bacterium]
MTLTEYKRKLKCYSGNGRMPADFEDIWKKYMTANSPFVSVEQVPFLNETAIYENMCIISDGREIHARCIQPRGDGKYPLVLMFHDLSRGVRGWHHMTRFIAQGYAVIALNEEKSDLDWLKSPENIDFQRRYAAAITLTAVAIRLPYVQAKRIVTWGEGLGAGLAIVAAALIPYEVKCAALNPMPADFRGLCKGVSEDDLRKLDYADVSNFAPFVLGEVLMGVCLMNQLAPPEAQYAIYNKLKCKKKIKVYPKYIHERVNFFENEVLSFLKD